MKKTFLFSLTIFVVFASNGLCQSTISAGALNGADWNKWKKETKIIFITGFMSGCEYVAANSLFPKSLFPDKKVFSRAKLIWHNVTDEVGKTIPNAKTSTTKYTAQDVLLYRMYDAYKKNDLYNKAIIRAFNTEIVQGLDNFYKDPNNSNVLISNAIYFVYKQLRGSPEEDIKALLPYLRGEKAIPQGWIIPIYDKNGKFVKIIEFP